MAQSVPDRYRLNYEVLFSTCVIRPSKYTVIDRTIDKIFANKSRYETVAKDLSIPWYVIGIIHNMECSLNFTKHLHNGDPLSARTVQVPAGRPRTGNPPFTWEVSAKDALTYDNINTWGNWTISGILYKLEGYNGFGYYYHQINSPYLWSFSNHYSKGKYVADGHYDPNAVSGQIGAAVLLRRMLERQLIVLPNGTSLDQVKTLGESSGIYSPTVFIEKGEMLQILLNGIGAILKIDGKPGPKTSNEYKRITGKFLKGDPRR